MLSIEEKKAGNIEDEIENKKPKYFFEVCTPEQTLELSRLRQEIDNLGELKGLEHPDTLDCILECAELSFTTRKFEDAEKWFRHAWIGLSRALKRPFAIPHEKGRNIRNLVESDVDIRVYRAQSRLAKTLSELRRFQESLTLFREALAGIESHKGLYDPELIPTVDGICIVLHEILFLEESEQCFRRLRDLWERWKGPMDPDTLAVLNRLAIVLRDAHKLKEADRICVESLDSCTVVLGKDHPLTQTSVEISAYVRHAMGLSEEAEDMFRLALACNERKLGRDHPNTVSIVSKIGVLLSDQGDYEQSEVFHRRALTDCIANYGREHGKTLDEAHFLGVLVLRREEVEEAEDLLRWAFTGRQALYGGPTVLHPATMNSAHYLALLVQRQSLWRYDPRYAARLQETEFLLRLALRGRDAAPSLGPMHNDSIETAMRLAIFLFDEMRIVEAENLWGRVWEARIRTLGARHKDTAEAAYNLGIILQQRRMFPQAVKAFRAAVDGYTAVYGRSEPRPAWMSEEEDVAHPILEDAIRVLENCEKMEKN